ncbi:MAG: tetratricopeptide repeat protein, partial [Acidobacteriota bacterium]
MTWKGFRRRSFILPMALLVVWCAKATAQRIPEKMQEALNRLSSGDIEGARSLLEEIIRENPRHGPARLQLGQLALERGLVDEAREHLQVATTSNPRRLFLAWHLLGRVFRLQGQDGRARECFQESLARAPHFLPPRLFLIEIAEEGGDRWEALAHYRKILEQRPSVPELPDILAGMAQLARSMGALELAECSLRPSLEAQPNNGFFHYLLGLILSESGRVEEALASCLRAVELGFRKAPVYVTLGNLYYQKMLLSESIAALGQAVERDPAAAETLASFALTSLTTEEYRALRSLLEKHVEAHPESLNTLYGLGAMYLREGDLAKAKELFQRLEKLVPQHSQVHYNLGLIHL